MKLLILPVILFVACHNNNKVQLNEGDHDTTFVTNDTIPEKRGKTRKNAVAAYMVPINNPLLQQFFGVKVYETPLTFQYLLKMQYEGMVETDTLKIPNFGTWPAVAVRPGKDKLSCIIGFLDKDKHFKEYKMLTAKGKNMKLTVLHQYYVGGYRTEQ